MGHSWCSLPLNTLATGALRGPAYSLRLSKPAGINRVHACTPYDVSPPLKLSHDPVFRPRHSHPRYSRTRAWLPHTTKAGREHVSALCMCLLLYLYQWVFRRSWPIQTAQGYPSAWFFRYYWFITPLREILLLPSSAPANIQTFESPRQGSGNVHTMSNFYGFLRLVGVLRRQSTGGTPRHH